MVCDNDPPKAGAATYRFIPKNRQRCYYTHAPEKRQAFFTGKLTIFCKAVFFFPGKPSSNRPFSPGVLSSHPGVSVSGLCHHHGAKKEGLWVTALPESTCCGVGVRFFDDHPISG